MGTTDQVSQLCFSAHTWQAVPENQHRVYLFFSIQKTWSSLLVPSGCPRPPSHQGAMWEPGKAFLRDWLALLSMQLTTTHWLTSELPSGVLC